MILTLFCWGPMVAQAQEEDEENIADFQDAEADASEEEMGSEEEGDNMEEEDTILDGGEDSDDESFEEKTEGYAPLKRPMLHQAPLQKKKKMHQRKSYKKPAVGFEKKGNSTGPLRDAQGCKCCEPKKVTKVPSTFPSVSPSDRSAPTHKKKNTQNSGFEKAFKPMCIRIKKLLSEQPDLAVPESVRKRCGLGE